MYHHPYIPYNFAYCDIFAYCAYIVKSYSQDFDFAILSSAEKIEPLKYVEDHRP